MWITPEEYRWFDSSVCRMTFIDTSYLHSDGVWYYPLHSHEWFDLVFCVSGTGKATIHTSTIEMRKGMMTVLKPNTFHGYYAEAGSDFGYCVLSFVNDPASPISRFFMETDTIAADLGDRIDIVKQCYDLMGELFHSKESADTSLYYAICVQLMYLMQHAILHHPVDLPVSRNALTEQVLEYIHDHYSEESLCLESIADHFFMSVSQISRLFKKAYNTSLINYLIDYRLCMAKDILSNTTADVKDISLQVGYSNVSHFSRLFLKRIGFSPKDYRKHFSKRADMNISLTMSKMQTMYPGPVHK